MRYTGGNNNSRRNNTYSKRYLILHENQMPLAFTESFKHERAHARACVPAVAGSRTQAKIVSEGKICKAAANFPDIPKNFFI